MSTASSTSSNDTALTSTPAPNPITRPSTFGDGGRAKTSTQPMSSDEAPSSPQPNASIRRA